MKNIFLDEDYVDEGFWDNVMISAYSAETLFRIPGLSDWIDDNRADIIAGALNRKLERIKTQDDKDDMLDDIKGMRKSIMGSGHVTGGKVYSTLGISLGHAFNTAGAREKTRVYTAILNDFEKKVKAMKVKKD